MNRETIFQFSAPMPHHPAEMRLNLYICNERFYLYASLRLGQRIICVLNALVKLIIILQEFL